MAGFRYGRPSLLFVDQNLILGLVVIIIAIVCILVLSCSDIVDDRWDFIGSTVATSDYVRLTPDQQSRKGGIWNNMV